MTRNTRNRFVAWLGIAAMWLAIVAPVISQSIAAHNAALDPQAALCDVEALPGAFQTADAHAHHHHDDADAVANVDADADEHAGHHDAAGHFDACSYCGLLAHHLPVVFAASHAIASVERVARVAPAASADVVVTKSYNTASARAPPVLS